jgi:hypothetical protein
MKYGELIEKIKNFESSFWFGEYIYFKALEKLEDVRANLGMLKADGHVKEIVKIFLSLWGRTVDRDDLNWEQLTEQLRNSKELFQKLQGKSLLDINFDDEGVADTIKGAYESARVKYIGATAISKILHLFNPELFVMWDEDIRRRKYKVEGSASGYLKFLKQVKKELEEAVEEEAKRTGESEKEIVERICKELPSKKLGQGYDRKTLAKLVDEYNWWIVHH